MFMVPKEMFEHETGDIYDAEQQFLAGQKTMLAKTTDPQLAGMIKQHIEQTEQHIENLNQVFKLLGHQPKGIASHAAQGLVHDADKAMEESGTDAIRDYLIAAAAAKVEHYEIAGYRGLITAAQLMGHGEIKSLLQRNLQQEEKTAEMLEGSAPQLMQRALQTGSTTGGRTVVPMTTETVETVATKPAYAVGIEQVAMNMLVSGADGGSIGKVKEVRTDDFLIDRPAKRDVYAPATVIQEVGGHGVVLNIPADDVDKMGWEKPNLM